MGDFNHLFISLLSLIILPNRANFTLKLITYYDAKH